MFETNLDSSVIISILIKDTHFQEAKNTIIKFKEEKTRIYISLIVYAEIWTGIELTDDPVQREQIENNFKHLIDSLEGKIVPDNVIIAQRAAMAQAEYRKKGGTRKVLIPDFLIGANAEFYSKRILTTNPRDFMKYFPNVEVLTPPVFLEKY